MPIFNNFIPTGAQYKNWSLPTKWGFWSALIGIPTGILGLLLGLLPLLNSSDRELRSKEFFKAAQELRYNREYLAALSRSLSSSSLRLPPGSVKADALLNVFDKHFELVTNSAYGEQKHLYELGLTLKNLGSQIDGISQRTELRKWMLSSEYSIDDVLFLNDFLLWYLKPIFADEFNFEQQSAFGAYDFPTDTFVIHNSKTVHLKYFHDDGKPIMQFIDYPGLID